MSKNAGQAAKGAADVFSNIQGVSEVVNDNTAGIQQVTTSAGDLARIASELQDMVSHFKVA